MKMTTLSSAESVYVAVCAAATEIVYLRALLYDIGFPQTNPTVVYEDNMSRIEMIKGNMNHSRSKHTKVRLHFVRDLVSDHTIVVRHCPTAEVVADIFTKALDVFTFSRLCRTLLGN